MSDETILKGNADTLSQGSWVRKDQGVAQDFSAVSQHWHKKCMTFDAVMEKMSEDLRKRHDLLVDVRSLDFKVTDDNIAVTINGKDYIPTEHAAKQLCNWCHPKFKMPQTAYNQYMQGDAEDRAIVVACFKNGQRKHDKEKLLRLRTYDDGTLRAAMSEEYSIIDNRWYMGIINKLIPGGMYSHWRGDADEIYGNVLIPDTIRSDFDGDHGGMLSLSNSEIGTRMLSQTPSIFRAICMNGCIWGQVEGISFERRHRWETDLNKWEYDITKNIHKQIPLLTVKNDEFDALRTMKAKAKIIQLFTVVAKDNQLKGQAFADLAEVYIKKTAHESTAFDVVDTLTRYSQTLPAKQWVALDMYAGDMLNAGEKGWNTLNTRAELVKDEDIKAMMKGITNVAV